MLHWPFPVPMCWRLYEFKKWISRYWKWTRGTGNTAYKLGCKLQSWVGNRHRNRGISKKPTTKPVFRTLKNTENERKKTKFWKSRYLQWWLFWAVTSRQVMHEREKHENLWTKLHCKVVEPVLKGALLLFTSLVLVVYSCRPTLCCDLITCTGWEWDCSQPHTIISY
jgi:hypothetical protein